MPADQRLRRKSDFDAVFREGVRASGDVLSLRARQRAGLRDDSMKTTMVGVAADLDDGPCRFGFAISARLGGAVRRNRIRRRLRESVRQLNAEGECEGLDVVVIARPGAVEAEFAELDATLRRLLRRTTAQLERDRRTSGRADGCAGGRGVSRSGRGPS